MPSAAGSATPRVGVLSLQGDFARHRAMLAALGVEAVRVTLPPDLEGVDALVIPGGESTTMLRLLEATGLRRPVEAFVRARPVLGTCAGVILLGTGGDGLPAPPFGVIDAAVERNAYGRQIDSFSAEVEASVFAGPFLGVFIRAPRIRRVGAGVEVVAWRRPAADASSNGATPAPDPTAAVGEAVGVRSGRAVGLCFHPELTGDARFHRWFLEEVAGFRIPEAGPQVTGRSLASQGVA